MTAAQQNLADAQREGHYTFCTAPKVPLSPRAEELCPLAKRVDGCEGFAAACRGDIGSKAKRSGERAEETAKPGDPSTKHEIPGALGAVAQGLVWVLVIGVVIAIAIPLVRAILNARRNKALADAPKPPNAAVAEVLAPPPPAEAISDAEAALRDADDHARRGDLARALGLYLAASLAALDRRGAIRLARSRTNGEYVRSCGEEQSRTALREIVREVDRVEFGHLAPTSDGVARIASRATSVVRSPGSGASRGAASIATMALSVLCVLAVLGCGGSDSRARSGTIAGVDDPSGDELPLDLLRRAGFDASYLGTSLASLPVPGPTDTSPVVVVDVTRVTLEEESSAHLLRWVEAGGVLVLFGPPAFWPSELGASGDFATNDQVNVVDHDVFVVGARVGIPRALSWPNSEPVAWSDKSVYAAHNTYGKGAILGVAGHELVTNIGVTKPENAGAFAALMDIAAADRRSSTADVDQVVPVQIRFARRLDGIAPPSNPFSALVQAGLGRGAWHALAAAVVLFLAFGIRQARARPAVPKPRRAFAEHVEATGAFYGRARALGHALASYGRFAEMRLRERVPRGADPVQFLAARAKVPLEDAARVWKRATEASAEDPPRGDELTTIRDLGAMLAKAIETPRSPR
ncbi:MAG: hypothetical protein JWO86_2151 [Myxococcaceae bacterium]|nr:hypothetical protein [Myxococcaceae bacterium]